MTTLRPLCVFCKRRWLPPEGVDAARQPCPACSVERRRVAQERQAERVVVRLDGYVLSFPPSLNQVIGEAVAASIVTPDRVDRRVALLTPLTDVEAEGVDLVTNEQLDEAVGRTDRRDKHGERWPSGQRYT